MFSLCVVCYHDTIITDGYSNSHPLPYPSFLIFIARYFLFISQYDCSFRYSLFFSMRITYFYIEYMRYSTSPFAVSISVASLRSACSRAAQPQRRQLVPCSSLLAKYLLSPLSRPQLPFANSSPLLVPLP